MHVRRGTGITRASDAVQASEQERERESEGERDVVLERCSLFRTGKLGYTPTGHTLAV